MRSTEDVPALTGKSELPVLTTHSMREVLHSEYFHKFESLAHQPKELEPCRTCKFQEHCTSCRFEYARQGQVDECMFLNEALAGLAAANAAR
jgi:radical SAM protein with 4Fe4S-binding SPASM domain